MRCTLILLALATSGCGPHIEHFEVAPRSFCPGDPITLDWRITGAQGNVATLETRPAPGPNVMQSVPAVHRMTASPSGRTVYVLSAANAEGRSSDQKAVDPVNSGGAGVDFPFGANIHCPGFASAAPLIFSVPAGTVSPSLRITSVVPRAEAGVLVSVSGPGSGDRVDGGTWYVRAQPPVGPRCRYGTHDYPPPETFWISLTVTAACR